MRSAWELVRAFAIRDFATDTSYKVSFAVECVDVVIVVAAFYYLAHVLGDRHPGGYDAFGFLLVGLATNNAMSTALTAFSQAVRADQQSGAIKAVLLAPFPVARIIAFGSAYPAVRSASSAIAFLALGAVFGASLSHANLLAAGVVGAAALGAFIALGLLSAACTLVFKRGDPVVWLFSALSWLLGGVFFPVGVLPTALQRVAHWLPITYALDALRATLLNGAAIADVRRELSVLVAVAAVGLPLSVLCVDLGIRHVKRAGTLGHS